MKVLLTILILSVSIISCKKYEPITDKQGGVYRGEMKDGKKQGEGTYELSKAGEKLTFTGSWLDDKPHGSGKMVLEKHSTKWDSSKKESRILSTTSTEKKGVWNNGIYEGEYKGETLNGLRHGKGTNVYPDGRIYEGEWKNHQTSGMGKMVYRDGSIFYEGLWTNNQVDRGYQELRAAIAMINYQSKNNNVTTMGKKSDNKENTEESAILPDLVNTINKLKSSDDFKNIPKEECENLKIVADIHKVKHLSDEFINKKLDGIIKTSCK